MTHHSYFTGFGGFDFAAKLQGIDTTLQCERDTFCRKFCNYFFPDVIIHKDIYSIDKKQVNYATIASAGFPCQNISESGDNTGIYGQKSKAVWQFLDIAFTVGYKYLLLENSAKLTIRGLDKLLCAFSENGYDAQWSCLRASDFGYSHKRERIFVVAYPHQNRLPCKLFLPVETTRLYSAPKKANETFLRITEKAIHTEGNYLDLCGVNGFPRNFRKIIAGLGNAVNITMAEYLFFCIKEFDKTI